MAEMRKAFLLSYSTIFLVLIIVAGFSITNEISSSESKFAAKTVRVDILNSFVNDLEDNYFEKILYVSGKAALQELAERRIQGFELPTTDGFKKDISNVITNGTIRDGNDYIKISEAMESKTLSFFMQKIKGIFGNLGIEVSKLEVDIVDVRHNSPWTVDIEADFDYNVVDSLGIASWRGKARKKASISLIGIDDPEGGGIIIRQGPARWIQHSPSDSAASGNSFLKRLFNEDELNKYGICKEDNEHCGSCNINCASEQKFCDVNEQRETYGKCI